jgi:hypothetical protein
MSETCEIISDFFAKLKAKRLPMHITEAELQQQLGDTASAYLFSHLSEVISYLKETLGLWVEVVLCPKSPSHPATGYITVYREGQATLANDERKPEFGPYWIPDELRF